MHGRAVLYALASAALFGVSTPAAKVLLGEIHPAVLAGLLYCGAGVGVGLLRRFASHVLGSPSAPQVPLQRKDVAWFVFRENVDRRVALGMGCLLAGAVVLSWSGTPSIQNVQGPLAILGACVAWGLDNNLTRKASLADPLQITELKGVVAGPVNILIGAWAGASIPWSPALLLAAVTGFFGYGVSLALYVVALRHLGAARTGAYFSTAPFLGAAVAVVALGENVTWGLLAAGALMGLGVWLHVTERHEHDHVHEAMVHAHPHVHDEHHQHEHGPDDPAGEPHTHRHRHDRLEHAHPHTPDMHHAHRH